MKSDLHGRTGIVTGGRGEVGDAIAGEIARRGGTVVAVDIVDLPQEPAVNFDDGGMIIHVRADLTDKGDRGNLLATTEIQGSPTFLINAHGYVEIRELWDVDEQLWDATFESNAKSVFFLCQEIGRRMGERSSIINFSSIAGWSTIVEHNAPYSFAKAAVIDITKLFARVLAPAVRVNCIAPGIIAGRMQRRAVDGFAKISGRPAAEIYEERLRAIPMARPTNPEEIARLVCQLLSVEWSYVTGQIFALDGGLSVK